MFYSFRLLFAALVFLTGSVALAQDFPPDGTIIREVVVQGTEHTNPDRVRRVMELQQGQPFMADAARRDLQAIASLGEYNPLATSITTDPMDNGTRVIVNVTENPVVNNIQFIGNVKYSAERLLRELDFKSGDVLPLAARSRTAESLREFYALGGYKNTNVTVDVEPAEERNRVDLLVSIEEGEKIKIKDLIIRGNEHFPDWQMRTWVSNSGSWLFFNNYYDARLFEEDLRIIEQHYRDDGYLDATARRGEFIYNEEQALVSPVIIIDEGPRYRIQNITITGHTLFLDEEVYRPFEELIGENFSGYKMREAIEKLRRLYGDQAYINAEFDADFEKNPESGTVDLAIDISENNTVYVGTVFVKKDDLDYELDLNWLEEFIDWSSPGVKEETIRREVLLEPGEKYRTAEEVRTEERLRNLGFFSNVEVYRQPTADPQIDNVIVEVEEDPAAGYVGLTAGVGEVSGPSIGVNYLNPNLFGEAKVLKAGATLGSRVRSFNIGYLDRHFMDTDNSFDYNLYRDYARYDGYGQRIYGTSGELGHPFSEYVRGYIRPRVEHVRLERRDEDLAEDVDSYGVFALRGLVVRDMINNRRWPTKGYKISGGIEPGYARDPMVKLLHSFEWVRALDRQEDWVYYYGHNFGLHPYDAERVGISERFFVGGTSSLRGFQPRGIGPRDEEERDVHVGGATMLTQRHELRRRFTRYLSGRLFVDAGVLDEDPLHFSSPRVGTGVGITLDLGAVSASLDLGAPVVKKSHDDTRLLHFRIRSNF